MGWLFDHKWGQGKSTIFKRLFDIAETIAQKARLALVYRQLTSINHVKEGLKKSIAQIYARAKGSHQERTLYFDDDLATPIFAPGRKDKDRTSSHVDASVNTGLNKNPRKISLDMFNAISVLCGVGSAPNTPACYELIVSVLSVMESWHQEYLKPKMARNNFISLSTSGTWKKISYAIYILEARKKFLSGQQMETPDAGFEQINHNGDLDASVIRKVCSYFDCVSRMTQTKAEAVNTDWQCGAQRDIFFEIVMRSLPSTDAIESGILTVARNVKEQLMTIQIEEKNSHE